MDLLGIITGAGLTLVTAWLFGRLLFLELQVELFRIERDVLSILVGSACLSFGVFLLCSAGLATTSAFAAFSLLTLFAAVRRRAIFTSADPLPPVPRALKVLYGGIFSAYAVLYLLAAMMPETSPDGSSYHLGNVLRWHTDRGFVRYTGSIYANLSQGAEMLFLFAFSFGRHSAATLLNCCYLLLGPILALLFGVRHGMPWQFASAGLLLFLSPVAAVTGTSAYNDIILSLTIFGVVYFADLWRSHQSRSSLAIAGLLSGFAYAIKYTGAFVFLYLLALVLYKGSRKGVAGIGSLLSLSFLPASLLVLPWLVKNYIWVANPLSPFFNRWFPNPYVTIDFEDFYRANMALYSEVSSRALLPLYYSVNGDYVGGIFGPWLLLLPLAIISVRRSLARHLLSACIAVALPAAANSATRLLLPSVTLAAPALCLVLGRRCSVLLVVIHSVVSWPALVRQYSAGWQLPRIDVAAALRITPEHDYLARTLGGYPMSASIDRLVPPSANVFTLDTIPQAYTRRRLWNYYESAKGQVAHRTLWVAHKPDMRPVSDTQLMFAAREVSSLRITQLGLGAASWFISEVRLYHRGVEVARAADWQVSACPNPWDVLRAFDGNDATEWSTWQAMKPGMYVEIRMDNPVTIDRVSLHSVEGQWDSKLKVDTQAADGRWVDCRARTKIEARTVTGSLRPHATYSLKTLGFDYIVASHHDGPGKDLFHNPSYWSVAPLETANGLTLYRIDHTVTGETQERSW